MQNISGLSSVQEIIYHLFESGEKRFEEIFEVIENHFRIKWAAWAEANQIEYAKLLDKKRGEIFTLLISDGNVSVNNLDDGFLFSFKETL
ncbi:hypothetical protein [Mycoplasmopsis agassizii]|nr:hypothetical protein [Mycoplasmopsis agassizii]